MGEIEDLRKFARKIREGFDGDDPTDQEVIGYDLAEGFLELDEILTNGGDLPEEWRNRKLRRCPRCLRNDLHPRNARNAYSRVGGLVVICSPCGGDEARRGSNPWPSYPNALPLA